MGLAKCRRIARRAAAARGFYREQMRERKPGRAGEAA